jgi:hypothetical protein
MADANIACVSAAALLRSLVRQILLLALAAPVLPPLGLGSLIKEFSPHKPIKAPIAHLKAKKRPAVGRFWLSDRRECCHN